MIDLPSEIDATPNDRAEAEAVVARISGAGSVAAALAADLAEGIGGRDLVLTAGDSIADLAVQYWEAYLGSAGVKVHNAGEAPHGGAAWIRLRGEHGIVNSVVGASSEDRPVAADDAVANDAGYGGLVGEVIGQGTSEAARYASLIAVADALVAAMRPSA